MTDPDTKDAITSVDDLEKKLIELGDMGKELYAQHRMLLSAARNWAIAWRSLEAVRSYVKGSVYKPEKQTEDE